MANRNRFNMSPNQWTGKGVNRPLSTTQPVLTYVGNVLAGNYSLSVPPTPQLLPAGWSVQYVTEGPLAGAYQVNHNLNTYNYSVVATASPGNPLTLPGVSLSIEINPTNFLILPYGSAGSSGSYPGTVTSNAAGTPFPTGWTVVNGSTGEYTITHNLGTTDYSVSALSHSSLFCQLASKGANSFLLIWWASQSTTQDCDFDFVLTPVSSGGSATLTDCGFTFLLTTTVNATSSLPKYIT